MEKKSKETFEILLNSIFIAIFGINYFLSG